MTIDNEALKNVYLGNGSTKTFAFTFQVTDAAHVEVLTVDDGAETIVSSGYTVTLSSDNTGSVTFTTAPASGLSVVLRLNVPFTQETNLEETGAFNANTLEEMSDKSTNQIKQLLEQILRCIIMPADYGGDQIVFPYPESDNLIGWNYEATALENKGTMSDISDLLDLLEDIGDLDTFITILQSLYNTLNSLGFPTLEEGDQGKPLVVKDDLSGYEVGEFPEAGEGEVTVTVAGSGTVGTFDNDDLSTGVLTITHNLGLSAPYTLDVWITDNDSQMIIPDEITGSANSHAIDLTSYGAIDGTWGYKYGGIAVAVVAGSMPTSTTQYRPLVANSSGGWEEGTQVKLGAGATINEFSTDGTLAGNSDTAVPTEKAVKTYVTAHGGAGSSSAIGTYSAGTIYQNTSARKIIIIAWGGTNPNTGPSQDSAYIYSDVSSPPTTTVAKRRTHGGEHELVAVIPPSWYWKYSTTAGTTYRIETWEI